MTRGSSIRRRGGDSNPRSRFRDTAFPVLHNRPLCHLSGVRLSAEERSPSKVFRARPRIGIGKAISLPPGRPLCVAAEIRYSPRPLPRNSAVCGVGGSERSNDAISDGGDGPRRRVPVDRDLSRNLRVRCSREKAAIPNLLGSVPWSFYWPQRKGTCRVVRQERKQDSGRKANFVQRPLTENRSAGRRQRTGLSSCPLIPVSCSCPFNALERSLNALERSPRFRRRCCSAASPCRRRCERPGRFRPRFRPSGR